MKRCVRLRPGPRRSARPGAVASLALAVALTPLVACSSDSPGAASGATPTSVAGATGGLSDLPAVVVRNLGTGESADLHALLPSTKPLLVWFWAPY